MEGHSFLPEAGMSRPVQLLGSGPSGVYAISTAPHPHFHTFRPPRYLPKDHPTNGCEDESTVDNQVLNSDNYNFSIEQWQPEDSNKLETAILYPPFPLSEYKLNLDPTSFYISYWGNNCLPALHPVFHDMIDLAVQQPVLQDAVLALAACNLSRKSPEMTLRGLEQDLSYRPNPDHWASSQRHYRSASTIARRLIRTTHGMDHRVFLATIVLFSCLESSIGNFFGFNAQSQGIAQFVEVLSARPDRDASSTDLLAAWMQSRYHNWWLRQYFSTFEFQLCQSSLTAPAFLEDNGVSSSVRRAMVLSVLCESHRLHQKLLLNTFPLEQEAANKETILKPRVGPVSHWYRTGMYQDLLKLQADKLDHWESNLPLSDLPLNPEDEVRYLFPSGLVVDPLSFQSHDAAMNYAYYITARIMQHAPFDLSGEHITDSDDWVLLLLRTAAGISQTTCLRDNTYTIGLSSLLLASLLHTCSLDVGVWIESWLQGFQNQTVALEEGSFPLQQIETVVRVINEQRRRGRNVFAISQLEDDEGGKGKGESYQSQDIRIVLLHGRERATGELFQESVVFD